MPCVHCSFIWSFWCRTRHPAAAVHGSCAGRRHSAENGCYLWSCGLRASASGCRGGQKCQGQCACLSTAAIARVWGFIGGLIYCRGRGVVVTRNIPFLSVSTRVLSPTGSLCICTCRIIVRCASMCQSCMLLVFSERFVVRVRVLVRDGGRGRCG